MPNTNQPKAVAPGSCGIFKLEKGKVKNKQAAPNRYKPDGKSGGSKHTFRQTA